MQSCGPTIDDGYRAALNLINQPNRPTTIIVINDMRAIYDHLRIADDISIASFGEIDVAAYVNLPINNCPCES